MSSPDSIRALVAAARRSAELPVVLIDGPSGAGKSLLADRMIAQWSQTPAPQLVRMDDLYPGWYGLDQAIDHVHGSVLVPRAAGARPRWRQWDWAGAVPGTWHPVDRTRPLIIEGCGTLAAQNAALADFRIWVDADDAVRKSRALARDEGAFDPYWEIWDEQFQRFLARDHPRESADVLLDGTGGLPKS